MRSILVGIALLMVGLPAHAISLADVRSSNLEVTALDGTKTRLASLIPDGNAVIIDFWATWCGPCRKETPVFARLFRDYSKDGLTILALATSDRPEKVDAYVKAESIPYFVASADRAVYSALQPGRLGLPLVLIFGRNGDLIASYLGYGGRTPTLIEDAVKKALARSKR